MSKANLKTIAAIMVVLVWLCLWTAGLWELFGKAVLWLLLAGFLWLLVTIVAEQVRRRQLFRKQGYLVTEDSERRFVYRERFEGGIRELRLPGEWIENGHPVYYQIPQEIWAETVPEWARDVGWRSRAGFLRIGFTGLKSSRAHRLSSLATVQRC